MGMSSEERRLKQREWSKRWKARNRDKVRAQKLRWANKKSARIRAVPELHEKQKRHRRTRAAELYRERQEAKAGRPMPNKCELCPSEGPLVFDHCHRSGLFRGWLCRTCNMALGLINDDVRVARAIVRYLNKHSTEETMLSS